ncbi:hypothetical protein [Paraflavitalea sp. CAU 1676]|uniref:hypothetical protein n=1 Tax=Paraflavitalea sp. CAU 1676 TaxID=3032598 RepID=UPI0023DBD2BA|nr:hypothetical protein [Paraflavitalea sp. CAU 1676]MDF2192357.1 hypothetical protein [Paraflavitalea sp. CAU 1676]
MKFQIAVVQNGKNIFDIDMTPLRKPADITRVFDLLVQKFPASEGFYPIITVTTTEFSLLPANEVTDALQNDALPDYLMKIKKSEEKNERFSKAFYDYFKSTVHLP